MDYLNTMQKRNKEPKVKAEGHYQKGNIAQPVRVFYKGKDIDLTVFAISDDAVEHYKADPNIKNLDRVVEVFDVYTAGRGSTGQLGTASRAEMEGEFGKGLSEEQFVDHVLREGKITGVQSAISHNLFEK
ncbi:Rtc3 protein [Maudiozyma humilis]|uniref:Rtc3 protein n=1 Tax=Maudiozyma humilis TaxID=51915 RepID=A0AAV5RSW6_MAUHU|nr:Rtc3 protein [Kazachstania humilis]